MKNRLKIWLKAVQFRVQIWREKIDKMNGWKPSKVPLFSPAERVRFQARLENVQKQTIREESQKQLGISINFRKRKQVKNQLVNAK